jgi:thiamine pyrophosphokinase
MPNHPRPAENASDDAEKGLERRLRRLARNMRAIGEGGGKPDELVEEIVKVAKSLIAYNEAYGIRPHQELIRRALANLESADE